jgi:uncharacterized membrane protein
MKLSTNSVAGLLYLLSALAVLGIWYILLFMDNPSCINPLESLRYFLTESLQSMWFRWLLILPVLCLTVSALHFSKLSQSRIGSICLFSFEVLLAIATWLTVQAIAIFATLPLIYSFKNMRDHLNRHSSGTPYGAP